MGAWGTGPFDNDEAADFAAELDQANPGARLELIRQALRTVADRTGYLDLIDGCTAVAAAAIVAAGRIGGPGLGVGQGPRYWARGEEPQTFPDEYPALALRALDRVTSKDSEWAEDYEGDPAEMHLVLDPLRRALRPVRPA